MIHLKQLLQTERLFQLSKHIWDRSPENIPTVQESLQLFSCLKINLRRTSVLLLLLLLLITHLNLHLSGSWDLAYCFQTLFEIHPKDLSQFHLTVKINSGQDLKRFLGLGIVRKEVLMQIQRAIITENNRGVKKKLFQFLSFLYTQKKAVMFNQPSALTRYLHQVQVIRRAMTLCVEIRFNCV